MDKPDEAEAALKAAGLTVSPDQCDRHRHPRPAGRVRRRHEGSGGCGDRREVYVRFHLRDEGRACVILRVENNDAAIAALQKNGVEILDSDRIYAM